MRQWVTGVPGLSDAEQKKVIGNGICPQQCAHALRTMLAWDLSSIETRAAA